MTEINIMPENINEIKQEIIDAYNSMVEATKKYDDFCKTEEYKNIIKKHNELSENISSASHHYHTTRENLLHNYTSEIKKEINKELK